MKILLLGHNGMLGHMVMKYLSEMGECIDVCKHRWPSDNFKNYIKNSDSDFLINCIGAIPQKYDAWDVFSSLNIRLPIYLSKMFNGNIIHPATDCEFNGKLIYPNKYHWTNISDAEDDYGISKGYISHLLHKYSNVKQIRTSIIGPEIVSHVSLLDWFMKSDGKVNGFTNHYWNGITTLKWATLTYMMIQNWNDYGMINQFGTESVSKYELLCMINEIFTLGRKINPVETCSINNKVLESMYDVSSIYTQLCELKEFYYI